MSNDVIHTDPSLFVFSGKAILTHSPGYYAGKMPVHFIFTKFQNALLQFQTKIQTNIMAEKNTPVFLCVKFDSMLSKGVDNLSGIG